MWQETYEARHLFYSMHIMGLICLPNFYDRPWRNHLHRAYCLFILALRGLYTISVHVSLIFWVTQDFKLFCLKLIEIFIVDVCTVELYIVYYYLNGFINLMRSDTVISNTDDIFNRLKDRKEKVGLFTIGIMQGVLLKPIVSGFLTRSELELEIIQKVQDVEQPENIFMFQVYIPYVDPSMPPISYFFYFLDVYMAVQSLLIMCGTTLLPFSVLHLRAKFELLSEFVAMTGRCANEDDGLIMYTNLLRNTKLIQSKAGASSQELNIVNLRGLLENNPIAYEYFYVKQIILFQKQLLTERNEIEEFWRIELFRHGAFGVVLMLLSLYNILNQHVRILRLLEGIRMLGFVIGYIYYFHCFELFAECNISLARAMMSSQWYECSIKTKHVILLFLRQTLRAHYYTFPLNLQLGYQYMVNTFKLTYSFLNVMRVSSK